MKMKSLRSKVVFRKVKTWLSIVALILIVFCFVLSTEQESNFCTKESLQNPTMTLIADEKPQYSGVGQNAIKFSIEGNKTTKLRLNKYYGVKRDRFYASNNGETLILQFERTETSEATLRGQDWDDEYVFSKAVLMWGNRDDRGSQHVIGRTSQSLELQLVHFAKRYKNLKAAAQNKRGILITCTLFESVGKSNLDVQPLAQAALSTTFPNVKLKQVHGPLDIKKLFPPDPTYFQYVASTKFGPCTTEATYIVFRNPLPVSVFQLTYFRGMRDQNGKNIGTFFDNDGKLNTELQSTVFSSSIHTQIVLTKLVVLGNDVGKVVAQFKPITLCIFHFAIIKSFA